MHTIFQIFLCVVIGFASSGCQTIVWSRESPQAQSREKFLLSHGFKPDEPGSVCFVRHYSSLEGASRDVGFPIKGLFIPANSNPFADDNRISFLNGWGFVVTADHGYKLDDLKAPCTVGTALFQVPAEKEPPKGGETLVCRIRRFLAPYPPQ